MEKAEIEEKIKTIFIEQFSDLKDSFDFSKTQEQIPDWDSMAHMEMVSKIEDTFNLQFELDDITTLEKPSDFVELVEKKSS